MEWPLPLWLVLREELAELRPTTPALKAAAAELRTLLARQTEPLGAVEPNIVQPTADESTNYLFSAGDVLDLARLKTKLSERAPELATLQTPAQRPPGAVKTLVAPLVSADDAYDSETLNNLLRTPDLYNAFPDLAESRWVKEQKPESLPESELIELNRHLLDAALAGTVTPAEDKILPKVVAELHTAKLSALCFSGGGIRSATFCLGVLQSLARARILDKFDYLSTVSGGGYVGGWLAAWTHWNPAGLSGVIAELCKTRESKLEPEPDPVFYLRNFSNYLTPRTGLLSADTWTLVAIYLSNLLLNWTVMLPLLMAILAVPYLVLSAMRQPASVLLPTYLHARWLCLGFAVLSLAMAVFYEAMTRPSRDKRIAITARPWLHRRGQGSFAIYFLAPLMVSGLLLSEYALHVHLSQGGAVGSAWDFIAYGGGAAFVAWICYAIVLRGMFLLDLLAMLASGILGGFLLFIVMLHTPLTTLFQKNLDSFICFAPPTVLIVVLIAGTIFAGLATFWTDDQDREYWGRMGAWVLIASLGWTALGAIALFGPVALIAALTDSRGQIGWTRTLAASLPTIVTSILGWSGLTEGRPDEKAPSTTSAVLTRALPIVGALAIVVILSALALAMVDATSLMTALMTTLEGHKYHPPLGPMIANNMFSGWAVLFTSIALGAVGLLMSFFIDVNKYSLHAMYRNRLIRAYLGASRDKGQRNPNPFTGFDPDDNLPMSVLRSQDPASPRKLMPFVNITLNLVEPISNRLAWQERKAESFTVTPLHAGSFRVGYRRAADYGSKKRPTFLPTKSGEVENGITLGTATAISGAAVSPNMGYNSSPIVEIILSLLNLRLGWWLGNPGPAGNKTYMRAQPTFGVKYFADDAFGRTSDEEPYVYLSDGGHFENLGLYEMVLRRCHTIVVIDADADPGYTFENLGNAIRKIRIDLGISIDFPSFPTLAKLAQNSSTAYCAVGKIRYGSEDQDAEDGDLIYVKPTIRGDEPADVVSYERQHPDFPHESTGDQWFTESQFESYRNLGAVEMDRIIAGSVTDEEAARILRKLKTGADPCTQ